jgi:hypothetical protein
MIKSIAENSRLECVTLPVRLSEATTLPSLLVPEVRATELQGVAVSIARIRECRLSINETA